MEKHWEQLKDGAPLLKKDHNDKRLVVGFEEEMTFDKVQRTLVLTRDAVINELQIDLVDLKKSEENVVSFLRELSQLLYAYVLKKKPAILHDKKKYFLHYSMRNRRILFLCMIDLVRYSLYSGGNILPYQPGVNINESGLLDIEKLRDERVMSFVTDSILKTNQLVDRNFVEWFEVPKEVDNDTW